MILIWQMRKLGHRKVKELLKNHTGTKWQPPDLSLTAGYMQRLGGSGHGVGIRGYYLQWLYPAFLMYIN